MTILDVKKKHPTVCYCELVERPTKDIPYLKNENDFFLLVSKAGYIEKSFSSEEISDHNITVVMDAYCSDLPYLHREEMRQYLIENMTKSLQKICVREAQTIVELYGLDCQVGYRYPWNSLTDRDIDRALQEVDKVYKEYIDKRQRGIEECILRYKTRYQNATSKGNKEEVISQLQCELQRDYAIDGRAERQYNKAALKMRLEQ